MEVTVGQRRSAFSVIGALLFFLLIALLAFAGQAQALTVVDVAPSGADFSSISSAIQRTSAIATDTVKIRVATGTYRDVIEIGPTVDTDEVALGLEPTALDLTIEGGWSADFTTRSRKHVTTIIGIMGASVISIDDSTVTLDGLTLSHGFGTDPFTGAGGGLWLCDSKVVVKNSRIMRAGGASVGGVMSINSDLTIIDSKIAGNEVGGLLRIAGSGADSLNIASPGMVAGGIAVDRGQLTLIGSTVKDNTSWGLAGGIHAYEADVMIKNSRLINNDARGGGFGPGNGGALYVNMSDVAVTNTIVAGNHADANGGGIFFVGGDVRVLTANGVPVINRRLRLLNATIANNTAGGLRSPYGRGGGLFVGGSGDLRASEDDAGATQVPVSTTATVDIFNSIIWGNLGSDPFESPMTPNDLHVDPSGLDATGDIESQAEVLLNIVSISYSDIGVLTDELPVIVPFDVSAGSASPAHVGYGPGNISADPMFVDSTNEHFTDATMADYHLKKHSPAIDTGSLLGAPQIDIDGNSRPTGGGVDMGAYEEQVNFDVVAPTPRGRSPRYSTQHTNDTKFRVIWSAVDPAPSSNDLKYEVWVRRGGTGQYKKWVSWTSLRHSMFNGDRGHTYYFRVRAKDAAGNVSRLSRASMTMVPYDGLSSQLIRAKSGFNLFVGARHNTSYYMDTALTSRTRGDFIRYRLEGRRFSLISTRGPNMSRAKIYVDGVHVKTIDLFAPTNQYRKAVWNINFPTDGTHIIKFVNLATPGRPRMDIDGLARQLK